MEVSAEAKRIMVVALGKLYSSRTQRGGLRLHRSLLLTLVMKSARDIYHAAQAESAAPGCEHQQQPAAEVVTTEPLGAQDLQVSPPSRTLPEEKVAASSTETRKSAADKENRCPAAQHTRKRRGKAAAEPDFLPCKKAKLEQVNCPQQLLVSAVLVDYVKCGNELGNPIPLQRAIAAC
ncbi:immediate early response gene 2 protein-like [Stegastes partitus]|uniref:Immediate early response gene 2 protein-like n=1 Tax=Stegastes partitus TaxID=144197 RepID=A0A3B5BHR6_9TELE|nr:PREDICTED: immediate early response gene 2 protein-like [Stegastes partitus]